MNRLAWLMVVAIAAVGAPVTASDDAARIDPALTRRIASALPNVSMEALVTFDDRPDLAALEALQQTGLSVQRVFRSFRTAYVTGPGAALRAAARTPGIAGLYDNRRVVFHGNTGTIASRAREAWDTKSTSTTPATIGGTVVDGRGVGVAVVDSGIDGTHPDLAPAMAGNKKWLCSTPLFVETSSGHDKCFGNYWADALANLLTFDDSCDDAGWVDLANTDTTGGHGTHVAGIVAGRGTASNGRFMGAAPGARLYGLGSGDYDRILWVLEAFAWIDCNAASVTPAIRVVNNSWGGNPAAFDPGDPIAIATGALVGKGLTMVFSAGNDGGTGTLDLINPEAKHPAKGVISVANYDDVDRATRAGSLDGSSSRGLSSDPNKENWPDVSAPGTNIVSTGAPTGLFLPTGLYLAYEPYYTGASGTSMSAPHVAGVIAMMLQTDPTLTPAQIEDRLEDTALPFATPGGYVADPGNPTGGTNFGAGHGLVDAIAAIISLGATGGSMLAQIGGEPHLYTAGAVDPHVVSGLQWTVPAGVAAGLAERFLVTGDPAVWPLATGQSARFVISGPGCAPCVLSATLEAEFEGVTDEFAMSVPYTPGSGTFAIEAQIDFGGSTGYKSFDRFIVTGV